jgi:Skp family chaperone for outer membrane proteins
MTTFVTEEALNTLFKFYEDKIDVLEKRLAEVEKKLQEIQAEEDEKFEENYYGWYRE